MTTDRWRRIEELFHRALEIPENQRGSFLQKECADDADLMREVERLLAQEKKSADFLDAPAIETEARRMGDKAERSWIGRRVGNYEFLSLLGTGGMGEVYRAKDVKLQRDVAIKVLPASLADDPKRSSRLEQEARTLASLNHPHIGSIYGLEEADGRYALILELVQGPTLAEVLESRSLSMEETLRFASEIAEALEAAHQKGIVHRDLKPANIKITPAGTVKVLDFGLAKAFSEEAAKDFSRMPAGTEDGVILGTPAYMSPEQARGLPVNKQTDIWAFGCVLFEMLTRKMAFEGPTLSDTLAAVLEHEPHWEALPQRTPPGLRALMERCLKKDARYRLHDIADARVEIEHIRLQTQTRQSPSPPPHATKSHARLAGFATAGLAVLVLVGLGTIRFLRPPPASSNSSGAKPAMKIAPFTRYAGLERNPTFSPDGTQVAFAWNGEKQDNIDIYVKVVGSETPLRLTTDPAIDLNPRWSPDGRTIAFLRIVKDSTMVIVLISPLGGPERKLFEYTSSRRAQMETTLFNLSWSPDSKWLMTSGQTTPYSGSDRILLVSAESGESRPLTDPHANQLGDEIPEISADARSLIFARIGVAQDRWLLSALNADLTPVGEPKTLPGIELKPSNYRWSGDGREILFLANEGSGQIYRTPASLDAPPSVIEALGSGIKSFDVSRDGRRLVLERGVIDPNIYRLDLTDPHASPERFASSTARDVYPQYSPDGKRIALYSTRDGTQQIWVCDADGSRPQPLTSFKDGIRAATPHWSPDSRWIVFDVLEPQVPYQVYLVAADGGKPKMLTSPPSSNFGASFSRDGRWIYFASDRTGKYEVWKMPADGGDPIQVTHNGGVVAAESPDGKTLYYNKTEGAGSLWKMPVEGGPEVQVLASLFRFNYAITAKGVYFTSARDPKGGKSLVQFLDFATGKIKLVRAIGTPDTGLALSPDGRYLLYAQIDNNGTDLDLVENFH